MAGLERQPASELTAAPEPRPTAGRDIEHSTLDKPASSAQVTIDSDRHAPPPERWTPIEFDHEVPNALVGRLKEILGTDYPIVYTEAFKYTTVNLTVNDEYAQNIITYIEHPDFCGSGGCSIHIYRFDFTVLYKTIGVFCSNGQVAFAGTVTNGYRDLINDKADFIIFDGTQYVLSGLPPEPASRSADRPPPPERCVGPEHAFSRNRHVPPPERWTPIKFEYGVPKVYVGWLKRILGRDFDSAYTKGFKYAAVNLKVDDKSDQDIITYIEHPGFCGSGGCSIDINKFDPRRHSYKGIGSFFSNGQVAFAGTVTNGYRDLINDKADFIIFDGTLYVESGLPPEPAAAQASPPGVAAVPGPPTQSAVPRVSPLVEDAARKFPFVTEPGAILCQSPFAIKEAKAALAASDDGWFEKTGCVRAQGGLRVALIEAPLARSRVNGIPTPSSDLPWRGRVYPADDEANAANVYFDPWEISTFAWATIPSTALLWIGPEHLSRGEKPVQFKSRADAERWYTQSIKNDLKRYVPHTVVGDNGAFQLLLGPAAYGWLDIICPSEGKPSCNVIGQLPG